MLQLLLEIAARDSMGLSLCATSESKGAVEGTECNRIKGGTKILD
jgi:hypothetical protein